jgi:CHASE3 domain sensor protein
MVSGDSDRWVRHTHEVLGQLHDLLSAMQSVESSYRGFALTGKESYVESYHAGIGRAAQAETTIRNLTVDNAAQQRRLPALERLMAEKIQFGEAVIALRRTAGLDATADVILDGPGQRIMDEFKGLVRETQDEELRLLDTGLDPRALELELTESVLMKRAESAATVLQTLRASGVQLAIDDFGTGYSSLSYLRKFPIDALKIDQSFVRQITTAPGETTIVTAVIGMGRSLKLRVVAEGVETQEELAFLQARHCDEAQGYYFSRPVLPQQFAKLLETGVAVRDNLVASPA